MVVRHDADSLPLEISSSREVAGQFALCVRSRSVKAIYKIKNNYFNRYIYPRVTITDMPEEPEKVSFLRLLNTSRSP